AVDDNAARVAPDGDVHHALVGGVILHHRRARPRINSDLHDNVAGRADHVADVLFGFEGNGPGDVWEQLARPLRLRGDGLVQIDGLPGVLPGAGVDDADQRVRVDIELD